MSVPERLRWAVETLAVDPAESLLEIGCGGGVAVGLVCERLTGGTITAIDRSPIMVERARARNAGHVVAGRARILQLALEDADFVDGPAAGPFAKVFAVNVNAFWTAPAPAFAAVRPALGPDGSLFLFYEPPTEQALVDIRGRMRSLLPAHGLRIADEQTAGIGRSRGFCIVGTPDQGR